MKKTVFLITVCLLLYSCRSAKENESLVQLNYIPYYLKVYEADSLYLINDYEGSYRILDSLFKIYAPLNMDNYCEYGVYLNSGVMSGHLENIDKKVRFGYLNFGNIQTHHKKGYEMYLAVNKAARLSDKKIKKLKLDYYQSLNLDLRTKMIQMYKEDQAVRLENKSKEEMNAIDEKNRRELNQIFKTYGFPTKSLIGSNNAYDLPDEGYIGLNVLFMHQSVSVRTKYLPILLDAVKKGYCEPDVYSMVYDKRMFEQIQKQYFGTFSCDGFKVTCELLKPDQLDSIRKSIGLPYIKYYPWRVKQFEKN